MLLSKKVFCHGEFYREPTVPPALLNQPKGDMDKGRDDFEALALEILPRRHQLGEALLRDRGVLLAHPLRLGPLDLS